MEKINELSLKLFNAVRQGKTEDTDTKESISVKHGIYIAPSALYAKRDIMGYFEANNLDGEQLNATFHKSWKTIKDSNREELFLHQALHYMTTYGTGFTSDFIYIPAEKLKIPQTKSLPLRVIRGLSIDEMASKALFMIESGMALDGATIDNILELLSLLGHRFKTVDGIKNKEALIKVIAKTGVYPSSPTEFLRYLVYLSTGSTLLIKDKKTLEAIKTKGMNITVHLNSYGLGKCATIFNRFKPIWLAFKSNNDNSPFINKMAKLSKVHHRPMPVDVLNTVTSVEYKKKDVKKALESANNFRKVRLLNALNTRMKGADNYLYRVRNGKAFAKQSVPKKIGYYHKMFKTVYKSLLKSIDVKGKTVKYPINIDYAIPSSEKMFIGNIPTGTIITGDKLVAGVYWENAWGATDLDLSAISLEGKIGWNSAYKGKGLMYSGDMTDASNGATELLYVDGALRSPALAKLNIFSGDVGCKFRIVVGNAPKVKKNHMMNPNELILQVESETKTRQAIIGLFVPDADGARFVLINTGFGNINVSSGSEHSDNAQSALYYQYASPIGLRELLEDAGAELVGDGECDIDLMPQNLQKDTFIRILS